MGNQNKSNLNFVLQLKFALLLSCIFGALNSASTAFAALPVMGDHIVPYEFIVTLKSDKEDSFDATLEAFILERPAVIVLDQIEAGRAVLLKIPKVPNTLDYDNIDTKIRRGEEYIRGSTRVEGVEPNRRIYPWRGREPLSKDRAIGEAESQLTKNDSIEPSANKKRVRVAVLDSGIEIQHPVFSSTKAGMINMELARDFIGETIIPLTAGDLNGTGTSIAALLAGSAQPGSAFVPLTANAEVVPLRILRESEGTFFNALRALYYALEINTDIIFYGHSDVRGIPEQDIEKPSYAFSKWLTKAEKANALVVVPAGDLGLSYRENFFYPARLQASNLISVARSESGRIVGNYAGDYITLAAEGKFVSATAPIYEGTFYESFFGSTYSAVRVTAALVDYLSLQTKLVSPSHVKSRLMELSQKKSGLQGMVQSGELDLQSFLSGKAPLLAPDDPLSWKSIDWSLDSTHPQSTQTAANEFRYLVQIPGAKEIAIEFSKIQILLGRPLNTDLIEILDLKGNVLFSYSGFYQDIITPKIPGGAAIIRLSIDKVMAEPSYIFGYSIRKIYYR